MYNQLNKNKKSHNQVYKKLNKNMKLRKNQEY